MAKKIAVACDHAALDMKAEVLKYLSDNGFEYYDFGTYTKDSCNYPDYAEKVCTKVYNKEYDLGILICGTGIGMSMAANKCKGIRAALCSDTFSAKFTRLHNDANVLSLPARFISVEKAQEIVKAYFAAEFEGGRHLRRVEKIACK